MGGKFTKPGCTGTKSSQDVNIKNKSERTKIRTKVVTDAFLFGKISVLYNNYCEVLSKK